MKTQGMWQTELRVKKRTRARYPSNASSIRAQVELALVFRVQLVLHPYSLIPRSSIYLGPYLCLIGQYPISFESERLDEEAISEESLEEF